MDHHKDSEESDDLDLDLDFDDNDDDDFEDIHDLMHEHDLDLSEAKHVKNIMDEEGLDADEAMELRDFDHQNIPHKKGGGWLSFIVIIFIIWGVYSFFKDDSNDVIMQEHPNYETYRDTRDCSVLEPENPYDYGSGHYAGFEWGENGNYCSGNSNSFIEGCEEYEAQDEAYTACLNDQ